ncbi:putative myosin-binding protein [Helianthus annuus]|uniref:Myosin-binding protein n=1 Tax=Helianthus annuus TaxID=4232 RepID=A0A251SHN8_HELAN|nr:myosin-binding protein 3 [Helianthus annuus]KAF5769312.1 putative myosin-binding protein [Helianthus annuus]
MAATHKTLFILTFALLEWILIIMLLFNSIFSYLIRKFATYYTLKPPCVWCSIIDHLFDSNNNVNPYQNLICEAHATEFSNHYYRPDRQKMSTENGCSCCNSKVMSVDRSFASASKIKSNYEGNGVVEFMDLPVEKKSPYIQVFDQIIPLEWTDSSTSCSRCSSLNGDEDDDQELRFLQPSCRNEENKEDKAVTIDSLTAELRAERLVVCGLYKELDEERKDSVVAANQAMVMITRLQEQKVALKIESIQNQRMMDEQAEYDLEVLHLLNELVMKLEKDKIELESELEKYKEKVSDYEGKTKAKMMPECVRVSCSVTKELLVDTNVSDSKNLRELEESNEEFEIEKMWILDKLKEFDDTLSMTLTDDLNEGIDEQAEASHSAWTRSMF